MPGLALAASTAPKLLRITVAVRFAAARTREGILWGFFTL